MNLITFIKNTVLPITLAATIMIPSTTRLACANELTAEIDSEAISVTEDELDESEDTNPLADKSDEAEISEEAADETNELNEIENIEDTEDAEYIEDIEATDALENDPAENTDTDTNDELEDEIDEIAKAKKSKADKSKGTKVKDLSREITITNTIDICKIQIDCIKVVEIYDGFMPTGDYKEIPFVNSIEIEKGSSLSSISLDSDTISIIESINNFPDTIESSYFIKAKIDTDGDIKIISFSNKPVEHDSTDVTVHQVLHKEEVVEDTDNADSESPTESKEE